MFTREPEDREVPTLSFGVRLALGITLAMTLFIGLFPDPFIQVAGRTALSLLR